MKFCWDRTQELGKDNLQWGQIGPRLVKESVETNKLTDYVQGANAFCPVDWWDAHKIATPNGIESIPNSSYSVHLWNEKWRNAGLDKDATFGESCLYEILKKSFRN